MCWVSSLFLVIFTEQKKKLKKGKKEEEEKPDTFTEKLVSHLVKNLLVRYPFNSEKFWHFTSVVLV